MCLVCVLSVCLCLFLLLCVLFSSPVLFLLSVLFFCECRLGYAGGYGVLLLLLLRESNVGCVVFRSTSSECVVRY